ncbi:PQQ-dependent sugar dehydrogenase [bacterium]|nr:PQQ-dependent sugar dehydrogenase [bacterium]
MPFLKPRVEQIFIPIIGLVFLTATLLLQGQSPSSSVVTTSGASLEAIEAASNLSVSPGFNLDIYASEPLLANPVSLAFDEKGRCYVVESHRRRTSVYDIRSFPDWLDFDFSFTTVEDRAQFLKENLSAGNPSIPKKFIIDRNKDGVFDWRDLEEESERIVLLEDTNQDGKAETSRVFADGFNTLVSGVAAGVLVRDNKVWFTCVPDLWQLEDTNDDGLADQRSILHHGFGVHIAYGGHDMHGLIMGPDGRIYFSIADRGSHVEKMGKTLVDLPHTGAVFRCNPDGTKLEVFATGLRNPQELAFDARGNLWTVDNNGDHGDKARLVYLVEGGDSGWRLGWQWLPNMGSWKNEYLWETRETNQGNYLIPPIAYVGHGPAGFAFYPGTGMPDRFKDHFFLADFPGGIRYFKVSPEGAGFRVLHHAEYLEDNNRENMTGKLLWGLSPVDLAFGPKPGVYIADWIQGWEKTGKGRIFRVSASGADPSESNAINQILDDGLKDLSIKELGPMLSHPDMRVRQETQFELVGRYEPATSSVVKVLSGAFNLSALDELTRVVKDRKQPLNGRIHALWGLGQLIPKYRDTAETLKDLLSDPEPEIVSQSARVLADRGVVGYYSDYLNLMKHPNPRAQFFGVKWLWKTLQSGFQEVQHSEGTKTLVNLRQCGPVFDVLSDNGGKDLYLQHACVMALTQINDLAELVESAGNENSFIRMGAVLALRRLKRQEIAVFLRDTDHSIVVEATRAINDIPIEGAQQQLAQLIQRVNLPEAALKRSINAQYRLGNTENAAYLISFAQDKNASESLRAQAILMLAKWANPPKRDLITGLWRPQEARDPRSAAVPLRLALGKLMSEVPDPVKRVCIEAMVALNLQDESDLLIKLIESTDMSDGVIVDAIDALAKLGSPRLIEALSLARSSESDSVYAAAVRHQSKLKPEDAVLLFEIDLNNDSTLVQQAAIEGLSAIKIPKAITLLDGLMDQLLNGTLRPSLTLDLIEIATKSESAVIQQKLKTYRESLPTDDSLAGYRSTLHGGNVKLGEIIFSERQELGCMRCHSIGNQGGSVGPKLRDPNNSLTREQILESIVDPNRQIAEGFESVTIDLNDGESISGILKVENETHVTIVSADGFQHEIPRDQIENRRSTLSLMPDGLGDIMSKKELRDLIEYLSQP